MKLFCLNYGRINPVDNLFNSNKDYDVAHLDSMIIDYFFVYFSNTFPSKYFSMYLYHFNVF